MLSQTPFVPIGEGGVCLRRSPTTVSVPLYRVGHMTDAVVPDTHGAGAAPDPYDPWLWLEDIHGEEALSWVREQNARTEALLHGGAAGAEHESLRAELLEVLDSPEKIPGVSKRGDWYVNFWRDAEHPRGVWRRTTWEEYRSGSPRWEVLLDVDALAAEEGVDWVFAGTAYLRPGFSRVLVKLSPDGGDAGQWREFDFESARWVENGFRLPTAKSSVSWVDRDEILVSTIAGEDDATESTYPRRVRRLRRGQELQDAEIVHEVETSHLMAGAGYDWTPGFERTVAVDVIDFHSSRSYVSQGPPRGKPQWQRIEVPEHVEVGLHREWLVLSPQLEWEHHGRAYAPGSLVIGRLEDFQRDGTGLRAVFEPDERTSLAGISWTRNYLVLNLLRDVASVVEIAEPARGFARHEADLGLPLQDLSVGAVDAHESDDVWITTTGFLTPTTLLRGRIIAGDAGTGGAQTGDAAPRIEAEEIRRGPEFFDASTHQVEQHFATSDDGTQVPYFLVAPVQMPLDGANPTLLTGYGGFLVSRLPGYSGTIGRGWLQRADDRGRLGVYVLANIRGGGEYGPRWHRAALREKRPRAYEDFAAVARDLVARGITSPEYLTAHGGSNGGLLMGNMLTRYPDLFAALSCGVPLLDMRRYTKLSAGASWIAEYGDPDDPDDWEFIRGFSPYHQVRPGRDYPPILLWTATSDDRVGPVQARKMAARLAELGYAQAYFHEELDGGHAGASDNAQAAALQARWLLFLRHQLGRPRNSRGATEDP